MKGFDPNILEELLEIPFEKACKLAQLIEEEIDRRVEKALDREFNRGDYSRY